MCGSVEYPSYALSMQPHPDLPNVDDVLASGSDVYLDSCGDLNVPDAVVQRTEARIRGDLVSVWPDARPEELDRAVRAFAGFYRHTLETGAINYGDARELGRQVASDLRGYAIAG
jgi:hypothetical protein